MYFRLIQRRALSQSIARRSHETTKVSSKVNLDNYQAKIQANTPYHFYQNQVLDDYIAQPVSASTLQYYIFFGKQMNKSRLIKSANWVRNELLVRLAHRIRDFQQLPFFVGYNPHIEYVYKLHWGIFETIRRFPTIQKHEENLQFCQLCDGLLEGGLRVLPRLARGLSESAAYYPPEQKDLDLFLNRMLRSKISRNLLTEQHIALTEAYEHQQGHSDGLENDNIGIIYMHCSARESVKRAKALVYQHVKRYHNDGNSENWKPPAIEVTLENNGNSGEILFAYIPEHLEHILYELLDNAVRFTLKHNSEGNYPPVTVSVSANESDIYFRISDQGGGIPKARYDHIWSYQARSQTGEFEEFKEIQQMPTNVDERASQASQMGHRHLGIGLTMSRVYAEYWGGELQVLTMDGHGTDAYVRIPRLGLNTENLGIEMQSHPVFKSPKHDKKKHHHEKKHEPKLKHKPIVSMPDQQTFDTSLTAETFSGNGWSQSHMIES